MPLLELSGTKDDGVALWHITEGEPFLVRQHKFDPIPNDIVNDKKRLEWLAGRMLIKQLADRMNVEYKGIVKDDFGKPYLKDSSYQISLSHSFPYVAAQISDHHAVGIDIEQPTAKLLRIGPRILDQTELDDAAIDVVKHCIYWCAKEALYKIYGKRGLLFTHHLKIDPFELNNKGELLGRVEFDEIVIFAELRYIVHEDYVLVYTKLNSK